MIHALTPQALATRGMTVIASHEQVINGSPARLLNVRQNTAGLSRADRARDVSGIQSSDGQLSEE